MLSLDVRPFAQNLRRRWDTKSALVLCLASTVLLFITVSGLIDVSRIGKWHVLVLTLCCALVVGIWYRTHIPRTPRGKIGFGLAIDYDGNDTSSVRTDFVTHIKTLVEGSQELRHKFHFIEFNPSISKRFAREQDQSYLIERSRIHFLVFGTAKLRKLGSGPSFLLDLKGVVRHAKLTAEGKQMLVQDMANVLPSRLIIDETNSIFALEMAAVFWDIGARYIIGTAAAFSGDLKYGEQLVLDARRRLQKLRSAGSAPEMDALDQKIVALLAKIFDTELLTFGLKYQHTREIDFMRESERLVAARRAQEIPDDQRVRLSSAMCKFLLHRDIAGARGELEALGTTREAAILYSKAFLCAYEGNLGDAYRWYSRAMKMPTTDETIVIQSEEFIQLVLDEEPEKYWLKFALGLINFKVKEDKAAARKDLSEFIARASASNQFPRQIKAAQVWLSGCPESAA